MRKDAQPGDYQAYKRATNGCLPLTQVHYLLQDSVTGAFLLQGDLEVTEEARDLVRGIHPSGDRYSSVVGAVLDLNDKKIKDWLIESIPEEELQRVTVQQLPHENLGEQGRRLKGIVWGVTAIDDETHEVWVEGVV